jgi:integrase
MALLAHDAGMRAAEIGGLDWGHLDLRDVGAAWVSIGPVIEKDGTIRPYPKGGKELPVALTTRTAVALRELRAKYPGRSTDLVFRNPRRDTPLSLGSIGDYWRRARMFAGLTNPAVKFHHLRHACAERLADAGTDIRLIQGVLRHANIATTQIYLSRVTDLDAQRAALHRAAELSSEPDDPEAND